MKIIQNIDFCTSCTIEEIHNIIQTIYQRFVRSAIDIKTKKIESPRTTIVNFTFFASRGFECGRSAGTTNTKTAFQQIINITVTMDIHYMYRVLHKTFLHIRGRVLMVNKWYL